jgi:hypothetical protein
MAEIEATSAEARRRFSQTALTDEIRKRFFQNAQH